jgi:hypothetical protein
MAAPTPAATTFVTKLRREMLDIEAFIDEGVIGVTRRLTG